MTGPSFFHRGDLHTAGRRRQRFWYAVPHEPRPLLPAMPTAPRRTPASIPVSDHASDGSTRDVEHLDDLPVGNPTNGRSAAHVMDAFNRHLDLHVRNDEVAANGPHVHDPLRERSARNVVEHLGPVDHRLISALVLSGTLPEPVTGSATTTVSAIASPPDDSACRTTATLLGTCCSPCVPILPVVPAAWLNRQLCRSGSERWRRNVRSKRGGLDRGTDSSYRDCVLSAVRGSVVQGVTDCLDCDERWSPSLPFLRRRSDGCGGRVVSPAASRPAPGAGAPGVRVAVDVASAEDPPSFHMLERGSSTR